MFGIFQLFFSRYDSHNRLPPGFISAKKAAEVLVFVMKLEMPVFAFATVIL